MAALEGQLGDDDVIFVAPDWMWLPFRYYYRGEVDGIGGRSQGDALRLVGVGTDYADLIEPRELETDPSVRQPIVPPDDFDPDEYVRVWTVGHLATPQSVIDLFGQDVVVMHYDLSERRWRAVVYPAPYTADPSRLPLAVETPGLRWEGGLRLLGYSLSPSLMVGREARLTLFWTADRLQGYGRCLEVRMVDESGQVWLERSLPMISLLHGLPMISMGVFSTFPITDWPPGVVVVQDVALKLLADLPPISYQISVRVVDGPSGQPLSAAGQTDVILGSVSVARPPRPYRQHVVPVLHRANVRFGGLRLFGYDLPEATPRPGHYLPLVLHWAVDEVPLADYEVQVRLLDRRGVVVTESASSPSTPAFPTSSWRAGDLLRGEVSIPIPPRMEGGRYWLAVRLVDTDTGESVPGRRAWGLWSQEWAVIGRAEVTPWPLVTKPPPMAYEVEARFGGAVRLLGYDLTGDPAPGGELGVTLYWQVEAGLEDSYKVFVHLTNEAGELVAQADGIPVDWTRPTTTWRVGEIIADTYTLPLPTDLPEGAYHLYIGFYDPGAGGPRLPVVSRGREVPDGRLPLEPVTMLSVEDER
ncbi:MAG TPA: hypothetical protein ENI37_05625 [Chloroflexi bacterium]|nr:hypothetical protein [Chloroflexota bacterium]